MMAERIIKAGTLLKVEMEVLLPADATELQVDEWLDFSVGHRGGIDMKNPLLDKDAEAWADTFNWEETGYTGREERTLKEERPDGSKVYSVRRIRERVLSI